MAFACHVHSPIDHFVGFSIVMNDKTFCKRINQINILAYYIMDGPRGFIIFIEVVNNIK